MGCPHTTFYRGQRILIILRDGTKLVRKFYDKRSKAIEVEDEAGNRPKILTKHLRSTIILKERPK